MRPMKSLIKEKINFVAGRFLSDDGKKISYDELFIIQINVWILKISSIDKKGLSKSAFKWFSIYLKSVKKDRLEKFKRVLKDMEIPFEEGDWQTIDRDCERNKLN